MIEMSMSCLERRTLVGAYSRATRMRGTLMK
jgi:hypothetical protein